MFPVVHFELNHGIKIKDSWTLPHNPKQRQQPPQPLPPLLQLAPLWPQRVTDMTDEHVNWQNDEDNLQNSVATAQPFFPIISALSQHHCHDMAFLISPTNFVTTFTGHAFPHAAMRAPSVIPISNAASCKVVGSPCSFRHSSTWWCLLQKSRYLRKKNCKQNTNKNKSLLGSGLGSLLWARNRLALLGLQSKLGMLMTKACTGTLHQLPHQSAWEQKRQSKTSSPSLSSSSPPPPSSSSAALPFSLHAELLPQKHQTLNDKTKSACSSNYEKSCLGILCVDFLKSWMLVRSIWNLDI